VAVLMVFGSADLKLNCKQYLEVRIITISLETNYILNQLEF